MNWGLFYIMLLFFVLGGIGIYFAMRKKNPTERKQNWLKYFTYILIFILLYGCICFAEKTFSWVCVIIASVGLHELMCLQKKTPQKKIVFYPTLFAYVSVSVVFYFFSGLPQSLLLYTLFTVCTFDAFCQISGQLLGKTKISPRISPNKTLEGFIGGLCMAVCTFLVIGKILGFPIFFTILFGFITCLFSFAGDLSASWVKRRYKVKDFSSILPGQGGFLDRFDSFITAGAFVYLLYYFTIL